jgi:hypothetical protein
MLFFYGSETSKNKLLGPIISVVGLAVRIVHPAAGNSDGVDGSAPPAGAQDTFNDVARSSCHFDGCLVI